MGIFAGEIFSYQPNEQWGRKIKPLAENITLGRPPNAILVDIYIPNGIGGEIALVLVGVPAGESLMIICRNNIIFGQQYCLDVVMCE